MKATPHSYMLRLSQVEKAVLKLGISKAIETGKLSADSPATLSRAYEILSKFHEIAFVVTGWDAQYILLPALNTVPVNMLEDGMYSCVYRMANHE